MIKPNELRLDNKLCFYKPLQSEPQILTVTGIGEDNGIYYVLSNEYSAINLISGVMPIPLTPEILEKCGFKNLDIHDWILKTIFIEDNGLGEGGEEWSIHVWNEFYQEHMMLPNYIYYLHQLQNLYFALTGEELNINLNVAIYQ